MKFSHSIIIERPRDVVTLLFADPDKLKHYQDGFVKKIPVSGVAGEDGAISEMHYNMNGREMVLKETITANQLPESFEATYSHPMMDNTMKSVFSVLGPDRTEYAIHVEYTAINGFVPRMMALLFPGMFTRQGKKWMENFKAYAEKS